jgi:hypothetical protein
VECLRRPQTIRRLRKFCKIRHNFDIFNSPVQIPVKTNNKIEIITFTFVFNHFLSKLYHVLRGDIDKQLALVISNEQKHMPLTW